MLEDHFHSAATSPVLPSVLFRDTRFTELEPSLVLFQNRVTGCTSHHGNTAKNSFRLLAGKKRLGTNCSFRRYRCVTHGPVAQTYSSNPATYSSRSCVPQLMHYFRRVGVVVLRGSDARAWQ